jgi:hypothetical protein
MEGNSWAVEREVECRRSRERRNKEEMVLLRRGKITDIVKYVWGRGEGGGREGCVLNRLSVI